MARSSGKEEIEGPRTSLQKECSRSIVGDEDVQSVLALLESGADPNDLDCFQRSALALLCSQSGHAAAARVLLDAGADASTEDMWGRTPLHWCADRGWLDTALLLLDNGAFINATTKNGDSPLLWASKAGHHSLVEHLLKAGSDPHLRNNRDEKAADVAADDLTRTLITSVIQGTQVSISDVPSLTDKSEKQILGAHPFSLVGHNNKAEENVIKGNEESKRPAVEEPSSTTVVPNTSPAFSLYSKQALPPGSGQKKLKITLKKK